MPRETEQKQLWRAKDGLQIVNMKLFSPFDLLILAVVILSAFFPFFIENLSEKSDNFVIFTEDEKIEISIESDTILFINSVEIRIKNGAAKIVESNCPNQICVLQKPLSDNGQIVCVPNKIIVSRSFKSDKKQPKVDVYAH